MDPVRRSIHYAGKGTLTVDQEVVWAFHNSPCPPVDPKPPVPRRVSSRSFSQGLAVVGAIVGLYLH